MSEQMLSDHWLTQWANANGSSTALACGESVWSWEQLAEEVSRRAGQVQRAGLGPGRRVPVEARHEPATVVELLGLWAAGAVAVPVDPRTPARLAGRIRRHCEDPGEPADAVIVTTSGTTGEPKGVRLTQANLAASADAVTGRLHGGSATTWICCLPLSHVSGLAIVWRALVTGSTIVLAPPGDVGAVHAAARTRPGGIASLVPTQLHRMLGSSKLPAVAVALVGGAECPPALRGRAESAGLSVAVSYGMSEMSSTAAVDGRPLDGVTVRIDGGEVCVGGPMRTPGYAWGARLRLTPSGELLTGDRGEFAGGMLKIRGRMDATRQVGGENVDPGVVRAALLAHPSVEDATVEMVTDDEYGSLPAATVRIAAGSAVAEAELIEHCRTLLPPIAVPSGVDVETGGNRGSDVQSSVGPEGL